MLNSVSGANIFTAGGDRIERVDSWLFLAALAMEMRKNMIAHLTASNLLLQKHLASGQFCSLARKHDGLSLVLRFSTEIRQSMLEGM